MQTNQKRIKESQLKKKNKIYLFIKNFKNLQLNWKLNHKKVNLFIIKMKKNNIIFELELSKEIRIYPVFYILLLESANPEILIQLRLSKLSSENKYEIKKLVNYNKIINQYLIK